MGKEVQFHWGRHCFLRNDDRKHLEAIAPPRGPFRYPRARSICTKYNLWMQTACKHNGFYVHSNWRASSLRQQIKLLKYSTEGKSVHGQYDIWKVYKAGGGGADSILCKSMRVTFLLLLWAIALKQALAIHSHKLKNDHLRSFPFTYKYNYQMELIVTKILHLSSLCRNKNIDAESVIFKQTTSFNEKAQHGRAFFQTYFHKSKKMHS